MSDDLIILTMESEDSFSIEDLYEEDIPEHVDALTIAQEIRDNLHYWEFEPTYEVHYKGQIAVFSPWSPPRLV